MGSWTKDFLDNTTLVATDAEVKAGLKSWSKSRLDNMRGASIAHNGRHIAITGLGEYWQSDDFEVEVGSSYPAKIVTRRIMKKLDVCDRLIRVLSTEHSSMLCVIDVRSGAGEILLADSLEMIPKSKAGQWIVIEYSVERDKVKWYYSPDRI